EPHAFGQVRHVDADRDGGHSRPSLANAPDPARLTHPRPATGPRRRTRRPGRPGHSSATPAALAVQALYGFGSASNAQQRAFAPCAIIEHLAGGEHLAADLLRVPRKEELRFDEIALEERLDRIVQFRNIGFAACRHYDAAWMLRTERRFALALLAFVARAVDLVEHQQARHRFRADLVEHVLRHRQ